MATKTRKAAKPQWKLRRDILRKGDRDADPDELEVLYGQRDIFERDAAGNRIPLPAPPKAPREYIAISDAYLEALISEFEVERIVWDAKVRGLRLRVGRHRVTWTYYRQHRDHGKRTTTAKRLGHWPEMKTAEAREQALIKAGEDAADEREPGKRAALKFKDAFAAYLLYLTKRATERGKPDRWRKTVEGFGKQLLLPKWEKWSLAEMSQAPGVVADWHGEITEINGPVIANRCAQVIRALYRRAARRAKPPLPARLPTAAIDFNREDSRQVGIAFDQFGAWRKEWSDIPHPAHRAYHLCELLTGARPGELLRLRWTDIDLRKRSFVIRNAKAENNILIPISSAIARALKLARDAARERERPSDRESPFVFFGCSKAERDALSIKGNGLRHTFRTVAADLETDDLISHFLLGHAPAGISQKYIAKLILSSGPAMREAQRKISRRITTLLG
jgi:integrase